MKSFTAVVCLAAATWICPAPGLAQDHYPSRPVTLVAPAQPGGLTDIVARIVAPSLGEALRQPVLVMNRPGAAGAMGAGSVAQAAPDGYTLLLGLGALATFPEQEKLNGRRAAFQLDQLTPVARLTTEELILVVPPDSPYGTLGDIVKYAKANPGKISYATTGPYGTYHVAMEQFLQEAGLKMLAVPYNGGGAALLALLKKDVDISLVSRSVGLAQIRAGKLRPLVVWNKARMKELPEVATLGEAGYSSEYKLWTGLFAPANLPQPVLTALRNAVGTALRSRSLQEALSRSGGDPAYMDSPEFRRFWHDEAERLAVTVRRIGRIE